MPTASYDESVEREILTQVADSLDVRSAPVRRIQLPLTDGRHLSALRFGTNDVPVRVVFLHGAGLNAHTWDATILTLLDDDSDLGVVAIDLAGHGDSSWRSDAAYSPTHLGEDVAEALSVLASEPVTLIGQSLGGLTALEASTKAPSLVANVVMVDITPSIGESPAPEILHRFYEVVEFPSREAAVDRALEFGLGGSRERAERGVLLNTRVLADGTVEWKHHLARLIGRGGLSTSAGADADALWSLAQARGDRLTLVVASDGFLTDDLVAQFRSRASEARVLTIAGGHNLQETAHNELAALTAEILATAKGTSA